MPKYVSRLAWQAVGANGLSPRGSNQSQFSDRLSAALLVCSMHEDWGCGTHEADADIAILSHLEIVTVRFHRPGMSKDHSPRDPVVHGQLPPCG
jgi:hypothetical protein